MSDARCSNRGRIVAIIIGFLLLPLVYNAWADMARSWRTCGAVSAHLERAETLFAQAQYGQALSEAIRARALAPQDPRVEPAVARARMHLLAWQPDEELRNLDLDEALADAATVEQRFPEEKASAIAFRGLVARQQLALDEAATYFERAIALQADNPIAHMGLAMEARRDVQNADEFIEHMSVVVKHQEHVPHLFALLGAAHRTVGDLPAASEWMKKAVEMRSDPGWLADLANIEMGLAKLEDAEQTARLATRIDPRHAGAWAALGQALMTQKKDGAIQALQTAARIQEDPKILFLLGAAYNLAGNYAQAAGALQKAVAGGSREPTTLLELATAMEGIGSFQDALRVYQTLAGLQVRDDASDVEKELQQRIVTHATERIESLTSDQPKPADR
jgi:tetratricopeptide (TPR) repeat protein